MFDLYCFVLGLCVCVVLKGACLQVLELKCLRLLLSSRIGLRKRLCEFESNYKPGQTQSTTYYNYNYNNNKKGLELHAFVSLLSIEE